MERRRVRVGFAHRPPQQRYRLRRLSRRPHQEIELRTAIVELLECLVEIRTGRFGGAEILAVPRQTHHPAPLAGGPHLASHRTLPVEEPLGEPLVDDHYRLPLPPRAGLARPAHPRVAAGPPAGRAPPCRCGCLPSELRSGWSGIRTGPERLPRSMRSEERRVGKEGRSRWSPY